VDALAKNGQGLNLTLEVRDAILKHSKGRGPIFATGRDSPATLEGQLVRVSDIIAYLAHDLDDALEAGLLSLGDLPSGLAEAFGPRASTRIGAMVTDLLENSRPGRDSLTLAFSPGMEKSMEELRDFMHKNVYRHPALSQDLTEGEERIRLIYRALMNDDSLYRRLPLRDLAESRSQAAVDYIAGMTDRFAIKFCQALDMPADAKGLRFTL
jgi:dGTPase